MKKKLLIKPSTTVLFEKIEHLSSLLSKKRRFVIITDTHVEKLFGRTLEKRLKKKGFDLFLITIPAGETSKTRETKQAIEDLMVKENMTRDSSIIALGGGVVLDVAGFVAATFCRGIPLISIPTTLLAMVDASIGGKVGVNVPNAKNFIGAYHPASVILIDADLLKTLPEKEQKNGFAEIIKYGLIDSKPLFGCLEKDKNADLEKIVYQSILIKKKVVEKDPHEKGLRRILNYGHTLAHALETLLNYEISHGEAVAIGLAFESYLSYKLGFLKKNELERILNVLKRYNLPIEVPKQISFEDLICSMAKDKKALQNTPRFVLLQSIGKTKPFKGDYCTPVKVSHLKEAYIQLKEKNHG